MPDHIDTAEVRRQIRKHGDAPALMIIELCDEVDRLRDRALR